VLAAALCAATVASAFAQDQTPSAAPEIVLPPRVGVTGPPRPLSLDEAIRMSLEQNNAIAIARLDTAASLEGIRAAEGIFDPRLTPTASYQNTTTASVSSISGGTNGRLQTRQLAGAVGLNGRTPWGGGRFAANFSSSKLVSSNQFARLNPQFPSALSASYAQPLFRGRTIDAERRSILLARSTADLSNAQLSRIVTDQLTLVVQAYWGLAFATRNLEVQTQALSQAQAQVTSNERQAREGTLAPIDVVEAQTQVANFRQTVASAQQAVTEAENRLKLLIAPNRASDIWNQPIVPTEPADVPVPAIDLAEAAKLAIARRPELTALETTRAENQINREYYADLAKPQFDLIGTYTMSGVAGSALTTTTPIGGSVSTVPPFLEGDYATSLNNLFANRFPTALVQLQMDLPLRNTTARANIARTEIEANQIQQQRLQLEQAIELDVRNALQALQSSQQRLEAASSARRNALEQYESERRRFESGLGTVFLVLQRQTALVTAQSLELRARTDLNQAIAQLDRAVGGTLESHGVQVK
ncbi:MAG TPA: TolC family protein, partial [Vicinamibacterales bacterium]